MLALRVLAAVAGALVVGHTMSAALRTFVLPRAAAVRMTSVVFVLVRMVFALFARPSRPYLRRDAVLAMYAPVSLVALAGTWVVSVGAGFTLLLWSAGVEPLQEAVMVSGSSLLTLGFEKPPHVLQQLLCFAEAMIGLGLVALLISYLPTIYAAFSRRETAVSLLEPLAGAPPSPTVMLLLHHVVTGLDELEPTWTRWREWFADVEESHTSIAALVFFRSPQPNRSWITAAGCVLDAASLRVSCLDLPRSANAEFMIRAGYVCLRRMADFFAIAYDPDPAADAPISIRREEFDEVWARMERRALPLKADRDQAWRDFAGWRVNYDTVLLAFCSLTDAPAALWSGDRSAPFRRPPIWRRRPPTAA